MKCGAKDSLLRARWCVVLVDRTTASMAILVGLVMIVVGIALYSITTKEPGMVILGDIYYRIVHPYENPSKVLIIGGICFVVVGALVCPFSLHSRESPHTYSNEQKELISLQFCRKCGSQNEEDAIYCKKCGNAL